MTTELDLYHLHQAQRRLDLAYRYGFPQVESDDPQGDPRRELADSAEREAAAILLLAGYDVALTLEHCARFDLLVEGALRVEVKASTWRPAAGNRGRYQALWHNKADVLAWLLVNVGQWVIIPASELGERANLAIWSYDPAEYTGQWSIYLGAWRLVDEQLTTARQRGTFYYQESLL